MSELSLPAQVPRAGPWWSRLWHGPGSIRRRLLLALLTPMTVVMVASLPVDYRMAIAPSERAYDETLVTEGQAIAAQLVQRNDRPALDLSSQSERILRIDPVDEEFFAVYDADGRLLGGDAFLPRVPAPAGSTPVYLDMSVDLDGRTVPVRMMVMKVRVGSNDVLVQVAESRLKREAARRHILAAMVLPNVLIAALTVLVLYLAVRLALAPLEDLDRELQKRAPDALQPVSLARQPDELTGVLLSLNTLLRRVQEAGDRQQRVLANMAHQLRTPLTGLRTQIELAMLPGHFAPQPDEQRNILGALDQLGHLIEQILTLSRAEAGREHITFEPLDLRALIERRVTPYVDRAVARNIDLGFALEPTPVVRGNALLIGEQLSNLIDNSLQHCPQGTLVTVLCGSRDGRAWMAVEDDGPGIEPALREQVFSRFFRGVQDATDGSGLGLAIVREIAQLHGAALSMRDTDSRRGIRFEVWFPPAT